MVAGARVQFARATVTWRDARSNIIHGSPRCQRCQELFILHESSAAHHACFSLECAKDIAASIVATILDYCNSLLFGMSHRNFNRLRRLQNNLACVVLRAPTGASATDPRRELHWLPMEERVKYNIEIVVFKAKYGVPDYLCSLLTSYQPTRTLRSLYTCTERIYRPRTSDFESHSFTNAAPTI